MFLSVIYAFPLVMMTINLLNFDQKHWLQKNIIKYKYYNSLNTESIKLFFMSTSLILKVQEKARQIRSADRPNTYLYDVPVSIYSETRSR